MSDKSSEDLILDALLADLLARDGSELVAELVEDNRDPEEVARDTMQVLLGAVSDFQQQYVQTIRATREAKLQSLQKGRSRLPDSPAARRQMLAKLAEPDKGITLQHRNLTEMTDEDVQSALAQILHLSEPADQDEGENA